MIVETENSIYEIDTEAQVVVRKPRAEAMRRDGEEVPILAIEELTIGQPLIMLLAIRWDGVPTVRITSPVIKVEP